MIFLKTRHSHCERAGRNFVISCWGNKINIAKAGAQQSTTTSCPTYPFVLNDSYSFSTSDGLVKHTSMKNAQIEMKLDVVLEVQQVHFSEGYNSVHEVINQQMQQIITLIDQTVKLGPEVNATTINGNPITWKTLALTGGNTTGVFLMLVLCVILYYKCGSRVNVDWSRFQIPTSRGDIERTAESEVSRQMRQSSHNIELQVKQVVRDEVKDNFNLILAQSLPAPSPSNLSGTRTILAGVIVSLLASKSTTLACV